MAGFFGRLKNKFQNMMIAPGAKDPYDDYHDDGYDDYENYDDYDNSYDAYEEPERGRSRERERDSDRVQVHFTPREREQQPASRRASPQRAAARSTTSRVTPVDNVYGFDFSANSKEQKAETIISHPKFVQDAVELADHVKSGRMVVVDLTNLETVEAQRIADYLGGVCKALDGVTTRVNNGIFTVSPPNHRVLPDYREEESYDDNFFSRLAVGR